jgi:transcriptional regulator with XRE-family HTH domain
MEFHEKLQELRKRKGLTQEELAEILFVSRAAISKWESGRGYPNIDSLKGIAKYFAVTVDELLSGEELLTIAEEDNRQTEHRFRDLVFGLLDCSAAMFFFMPFFGQKAEGTIRAVTLLSLTDIAPYLKIAYYAVVVAMTAWGIGTLALQNWGQAVWVKYRSGISMALNGFGVLLFIISTQPYGASLLFLFLTIKAVMIIKHP